MKVHDVDLLCRLIVGIAAAANYSLLIQFKREEEAVAALKGIQGHRSLSVSRSINHEALVPRAAGGDASNDAHGQPVDDAHDRPAIYALAQPADDTDPADDAGAKPASDAPEPASRAAPVEQLVLPRATKAIAEDWAESAQYEPFRFNFLPRDTDADDDYHTDASGDTLAEPANGAAAESASDANLPTRTCFLRGADGAASPFSGVSTLSPPHEPGPDLELALSPRQSSQQDRCRSPRSFRSQMARGSPPKLEASAYTKWNENRGRFEMLETELDRIKSNRLPAHIIEVKSSGSESRIIRMCSSLQETVFGMCELEWIIDLIRKPEPARPPPVPWPPRGNNEAGSSRTGAGVDGDEDDHWIVEDEDDRVIYHIVASGRQTKTVRRLMNANLPPWTVDREDERMLDVEVAALEEELLEIDSDEVEELQHIRRGRCAPRPLHCRSNSLAPAPRRVSLFETPASDAQEPIVPLAVRPVDPPVPIGMTIVALMGSFATVELDSSGVTKILIGFLAGTPFLVEKRGSGQTLKSVGEFYTNARTHAFSREMIASIFALLKPQHSSGKQDVER
ncbi:hypothetical protein BDK51DRAFT_28086 [Blyttiomyces helicus]|uniref:DUF7607 domain-containing protein n=1 Tax=Blyttiomyces helicus TaxID=388810 RepID=A0A4P9W5W3_9FUNG|nr:hypothetical protein BDK51DRAFT_28086 [Blyttiomyces helicus]|eukprot:RKO87819.1 hypothetical protein BDK51DRAFT_28086 [Blyttiomyces helicus]